MNDYKKLLYNQVPLKILSIISNRPGAIFSAKEIEKIAKSSKGSTNQTLRLLLNTGIITRIKKGNIFLYKLNMESIILRQFKIFENALMLQHLLAEIKPYCTEITLYGSRADGTNNWQSDVDLFVISEYKDELKKIIGKCEQGEIKYQILVNDPLEALNIQKDDNVFYEQIKKGITLWKGGSTYDT